MDLMLYYSVVAGCILFDVLSFVCARDVMRDFLRGAIGKNRAKKIWSSMSFSEKLSLKKLKTLCADGSGPFMKYYSLYYIFLFSLAPRYLIVLFAVLWSNTLGKAASIITVITVLALSFAVTLVFRIPQLPDGTTKYIHYRPKRRK